jgi:dihydroorotate dehydrogenase
MMSVYSMTGFASAQHSNGHASGALEAKQTSVAQLGLEIRSVNSRFLDLSFRLPEDLRQWEPALRELLDALRAANQWQRPVFLKISPDESLDQLEQVIATALTAGISGIIATNTTISRPNLHSANANEVGGLSGVPLRDPAMTTLRHVARLTDGKLPIISVGGISSAQDVYARLRAGASLVQLYTALVYKGPAIVAQLSWGLAALLRRDGVSDVRQIIGVDRNLPA